MGRHGSFGSLADRPVWAFQDDAGNWLAFDADDAAKLDVASRNTQLIETADLSFNQGFDVVYAFDFQAGTQTNMESNKVRKVQKVDAANIQGAVPIQSKTVRG